MYSSNKERGTAFEKEVVSRLSKNGWWVHFLAPDVRGAQPFDLIAMKDGVTIVGDCKTCEKHMFYISRLEVNQILAFNKWLACGGTEPQIFVKYKGEIKVVKYKELLDLGKVDLDVV